MASGRTINQLAALTNDVVYGFDSFEGLPSTWRTNFDEGMFKQAQIPNILSSIELRVGLFQNTIKDFVSLRNANKSITLLHIECDLFSSSITIFDEMKEVSSG